MVVTEAVSETEREEDSRERAGGKRGQSQREGR